MRQNLVRFDTWEQVLDAAREGIQLYYEAPLDAVSAFPAKRVAVVRVYKNGKLRVDPQNNQADPFTCDSGHLNRFRRQPKPDDLVGEYIEGIYRCRWHRDGSCVVFSTVNGAWLGEYRDGEWDDMGRLPDYVHTFCMRFQRSEGSV